MSSRRRLPQEIYDHIIDLFCDDPETLKQCSLVSKAWVSRTQNHLFSDIALTPTNYPKWQKVFPDPANSPACHTRILTVGSILGDAEDVRWIQSFSRVKRLIVSHHRRRPDVDDPYLVPLYGLAHSLKSLRMFDILFPHPEFLSLIRSFPLFEDLALSICDIYDRATAAGPPTPAPSPALTGTLEIFGMLNLGVTTRFLLCLQGGLRFRKIRISHCSGARDLTSVWELVAACSDTLECLDVLCAISGNNTGSIDLSKATKLKDIAFQCVSFNSAWITMTLRTINPEHRNLQQISIYFTSLRNYWNDGRVVKDFGKEVAPLRWSDLDCLLIELWESHSVHSKVVCPRTKHGSATVADWARFFVPQLVERGIFDPVDVEEPPEPRYDWC